ncbi:MAG: MFS transporter [Acidobacteria bacterium]|nr:MAG: MFS transporter [Acidobacteriota bacterium]
MTSNLYLVKGAVVAALGGLLFGFDTAVIAGAIGDLTRTYNLTPGLLGVTVSSALLGTIFGAMLAGLPSDRFGPRDTLRILAIFYFVSALGCALAWDWYALLFFRIIGGLAIGGSSVLGPMYIAEISPAGERGWLVAFFQFNVVAGILLAYFSNYLFGLANLGAAEWRWMLGIAALPAVVFFVMLFGIPNSPRWLMRKDRSEEAGEVLRLLGEQQYEQRLQEIKESIQLENVAAHAQLFTRRYAFPIFLAVSIGFFNQLSGINAIVYYMTFIFNAAGFGTVSASLQSVVVGLTLLIFTTAGMLTVDRVGRKTLLLIGAVGMTACQLGLALIFLRHEHLHLLLWLLMGYIAFFALSQGTVIWIYLGEVFPNTVRAKGQSLGSFAHWFMNALISLVFPAFAASSAAYPFLLFAIMTSLQFVVVLLVYPETKGLTLEEMHRVLRLPAPAPMEKPV